MGLLALSRRQMKQKDLTDISYTEKYMMRVLNSSQEWNDYQVLEVLGNASLNISWSFRFLHLIDSSAWL